MGLEVDMAVAGALLVSMGERRSFAMTGILALGYGASSLAYLTGVYQIATGAPVVLDAISAAVFVWLAARWRCDVCFCIAALFGLSLLAHAMFWGWIAGGGWIGPSYYTFVLGLFLMQLAIVAHGGGMRLVGFIRRRAGVGRLVCSRDGRLGPALCFEKAPAGPDVPRRDRRFNGGADSPVSVSTDHAGV